MSDDELKRGGCNMDVDEIGHEARRLKVEHIERHPDNISGLTLHLPLSYAETLWAWFRQRLDPDELRRAESGPKHPCEGGSLYGMRIRVEDNDEGQPWVMSQRLS